MNRGARAPGFIEGVLVAAVLSVVGGTLHLLLWSLISPRIGEGLVASDARLLAILATSLCYLLYLLWRSRASAGRISMALLWAGISLPVLLLVPRWTLAVQLTLLWLTRSLFLQRGFSAALGDLALMLVGIGAGAWAIGASGSLAAAIWTFLLVQAPFGAVGGYLSSILTPGNADLADAELVDVDLGGGDRFERAEQSAAASLRRLAGAAGRR